MVTERETIRIHLMALPSEQNSIQRMDTWSGRAAMTGSAQTSSTQSYRVGTR